MNTNAISFCELLHIFQEDAGEQSNIIPKIMKAAKFESIDRIYMGSNFCCRYFIKYAKMGMEKITSILRESAMDGVKITLCLPIFSEGYLKDGKALTVELLESYAEFIDEVTVNDFGMLDYASSFENVRINVGRMMNKDARDIRYDDYFNSVHTPSTCTLQNSIFQKYGVAGYEFDITNRFLQFGDFDSEIAIYAPYCFATMGNICEYAGAALPIEKKFRANGACAFTCTKMNIEYTSPHEERYLKWGRAVFFKVDDFTIQAKNGYRLVYEPFELFLRGTENE